MVTGICFGYLDRENFRENSFIAGKRKQITIANQSILCTGSPKFESTMVGPLLQWAVTTGKKYLFVQEYGHVLDTQQDLRDCCRVLAKSGRAALCYFDDAGRVSTRAMLFDLGRLSTFSANSGGVAHFDPQAWENQGFFAEIPTAIKSESWFINPVGEVDLVEHAFHNFISFAHRIKNEDTYSYLEEYGVWSQESKLIDFRKWRSHLTPIVPPYSNPSSDVRPTQFLTNIYSFGSGFKSLLLLPVKGFNTTTRVTHYSINRRDLKYFEHLISTWDGINLPRFIEKSSAHTASIKRSGLSIVNEVWRDILLLAGGEQAFKTLWNFFKRLKHQFIYCDPMASPERVLDFITADPKSYIYWGDAFSSRFVHLNYPIHYIAQQYDRFYQGLHDRCPHITMDGLDYWGNQVRTHFYKNHK